MGSDSTLGPTIRILRPPRKNPARRQRPTFREGPGNFRRIWRHTGYQIRPRKSQAGGDRNPHRRRASPGSSLGNTRVCGGLHQSESPTMGRGTRRPDANRPTRTTSRLRRLHPRVLVKMDGPFRTQGTFSNLWKKKSEQLFSQSSQAECSTKSKDKFSNCP